MSKVSSIPRKSTIKRKKEVIEILKKIEQSGAKLTTKLTPTNINRLSRNRRISTVDGKKHIASHHQQTIKTESKVQETQTVESIRESPMHQAMLDAVFGGLWRWE